MVKDPLINSQIEHETTEHSIRLGNHERSFSVYLKLADFIV